MSQTRLGITPRPNTETPRINYGLSDVWGRGSGPARFNAPGYALPERRRVTGVAAELYRTR
jgi:hypothetical protein